MFLVYIALLLDHIAPPLDYVALPLDYLSHFLVYLAAPQHVGYYILRFTPVAGKGPRSAYYYTTLHLALHISPNVLPDTGQG